MVLCLEKKQKRRRTNVRKSFIFTLYSIEWIIPLMGSEFCVSRLPLIYFQSAILFCPSSYLSKSQELIHKVGGLIQFKISGANQSQGRKFKSQIRNGIGKLVFIIFSFLSFFPVFDRWFLSICMFQMYTWVHIEIYLIYGQFDHLFTSSREACKIQSA